jgi:hypothetical protein
VAHFSPIEAGEPIILSSSKASTRRWRRSSDVLWIIVRRHDLRLRRIRRNVAAWEHELRAAFAERALTIGRRKLSVGSTTSAAYIAEGENLNDGSIKFISAIRIAARSPRLN